MWINDAGVNAYEEPPAPGAPGAAQIKSSVQRSAPTGELRPNLSNYRHHKTIKHKDNGTFSPGILV